MRKRVACTLGALALSLALGGPLGAQKPDQEWGGGAGRPTTVNTWDRLTAVLVKLTEVACLRGSIDPWGLCGDAASSSQQAPPTCDIRGSIDPWGCTRN